MSISDIKRHAQAILRILSGNGYCTRHFERSIIIGSNKICEECGESKPIKPKS